MKTRAVFTAVIANFVALPVSAQTTILQSNVGTGCSSVCINGNCTTTCNGEVTETTSAVQGNGDIQEKRFDLKGFTSLAVSDLAVSIKQGETFSVKLLADSNLLDKASVKLQGDQLVVSLKNGHYNEATMSLEVVMPDLTRVEQTGADTLTFSGFDQSVMEIQIDGSGKMVGTNSIVSNLSLLMGGAGEADFLGTELTRASIAISGTVNVSLNFAESTRVGTAEISGNITDVAEVEVCGDPKNRVETSGVADFSIVDC